MDALEDTEEPTLETHRLRNQADFAAKFFGRLAEYKYRLHETVLVDGRLVITDDLPIERLRRKKYLLTELHSTLIPLLRNHIISLWQALWGPNRLQIGPASTLKLVIEIQQKLELTLDRIICVINDIIPSNIYGTENTDDQHFKEFKRYRIVRLDNSIRQELKDALADHQARAQAQSVVHLLRSIESVVKWSSESELHEIVDDWKSKIEEMSTEVDGLLHVVDAKNSPYPRPIIELAHTFIPVVKLAKIFFHKMTTDVMAKRKLPLSTDMSSEQLGKLGEYVGDIRDVLSGLHSCLPSIAGHAHHSSPGTISDELTGLLTHFQQCLVLVDIYIIPSCTDINGCSARNSLKTWLVTWITLFYQSTHNAIQACNSIPEDWGFAP
ncbi:hypothetical protein PTTG_26620 [Puccinia triticina 1-1 BBBD Race 1]|uniref:Uncharacterized protein n=1 Tax=Puccinia triticina (isolate 1-1 / race 1 (BBBD)) TaxID=630390 RepID=A0A180GT14_PUCT1|nr:hypothetical protein PTTG_26620 [Puccinia triticina 1-1 BBBD Race 1]